MEEKGIVVRECLPLEPRFPLPGCRGTTALVLPAAGGGGASAARLRWETTAVNNPFLLHVVVQSTSDRYGRGRTRVVGEPDTVV